MIKTSLIALLAVVAVASPAFAMSAPVVIEEHENSPYYAETDVLARLQQRGVDATSVENWGTLIRAYVRQDDGTETQLFFTRDSLTPVNI